MCPAGEASSSGSSSGWNHTQQSRRAAPQARWRGPRSGRPQWQWQWQYSHAVVLGDSTTKDTEELLLLLLF
jgi:hypothetical protein